MILINETQFEAHLCRTMLSDDVILGTIVAKGTYAILDDGRPELTRKQHPVVLGNTKIAGVAFPPDSGYGKEGVDVLAVASAFAPNGRPTPAMIAGMTVGDHYLGLAVIGDRRWQKRWSGYVATDPVPFLEMPITWDRAYGGCAKVGGNELPFTDNMTGKGYLLDASTADGVELPNIEDPACLIREPDDRPRPVSFCPLPSGTSYAADALEDVDEDGGGLTRALYNVAVPAHRLPQYPSGAALRLHNLTPEASPDYRLPLDAVVAEVTIGIARYEFAGQVDTLLVMPTQREIILTHRIVFRYDYARGLARVARLRRTRFQESAVRREAVA